MHKARTAFCAYTAKYHLKYHLEYRLRRVGIRTCLNILIVPQLQADKTK